MSGKDEDHHFKGVTGWMSEILSYHYTTMLGKRPSRACSSWTCRWQSSHE